MAHTLWMRTIPRLAYTRDEAAQALGVSVCTVDRLIKKRLVKPARVMGRTLIPISELDKLLSEDYLIKTDGRRNNGRKRAR